MGIFWGSKGGYDTFGRFQIEEEDTCIGAAIEIPLDGARPLYSVQTLQDSLEHRGKRPED
jgi:hypothetical protein